MPSAGVPRIAARGLLAALQRAAFPSFGPKGVMSVFVILMGAPFPSLSTRATCGFGAIAAILKAAQMSADDLRRLL